MGRLKTTVLKGHSIMTVENHCIKGLQRYEGGEPCTKHRQGKDEPRASEKPVPLKLRASGLRRSF